MPKNKTKSVEPTLSDVLEAVNDGFTNVEHRFQKIEHRLDSMDTRLDSMDQRLNTVESQMVTKEYLDDKLADLRGDLVVMMRKEDNKLKKLVDILEQHQVISGSERTAIFALEPFAQS